MPAVAASAATISLVLGREGLAVVAGEVQVAEDLLAHPDRHPEEAAHRRMVGREADRALVAGEVVETHGVRLLDEQAEQALALGEVTDLRRRSRRPCRRG